MQRYRVWSLLVLASWFAFPGLAFTQEPAHWSAIKIQRSNESEVFTLFGAPDEVVARFSWSEWGASRYTLRDPRSYVFRYKAASSNSSILDGPAGAADSVDVKISNGWVITVTWDYGGPTARAAAQILRSDPDMQVSALPKSARASKPMPNGIIFAELGPNDTKVRVSYELK